MHHTFLSLFLPTALCVAALGLGAPVRAATPASAPPADRQAAAPPAALSLESGVGHAARRPFALLPPSGRAG